MGYDALVRDEMEADLVEVQDGGAELARANGAAEDDDGRQETNDGYLPIPKDSLICRILSASKQQSSIFFLPLPLSLSVICSKLNLKVEVKTSKANLSLAHSHCLGDSMKSKQNYTANNGIAKELYY